MVLLLAQGAGRRLLRCGRRGAGVEGANRVCIVRRPRRVHGVPQRLRDVSRLVLREGRCWPRWKASNLYQSQRVTASGTRRRCRHWKREEEGGEARCQLLKS